MASRSPRLRRPARHHRLRQRARRLVWTVLLTSTLLLVTADAAHADSGTSAPAALSWMDIKDSHGISIWKYEMSLDRGGVTSPGKVIWSFLVDLAWSGYVSCVAVAIWLIDWVLSFGWLTALTHPVLGLAESLSSIVDRLGLTPVLLTVAAVVAVLWMARGKWVLGTYELFTSLLIASLALGVLANPVALVVGDDGLIMQSRDIGLAVANGLANDGQPTGDAEQTRADVTGMLTDTFVRQPHQLINFGAVLDGGKCEEAYSEVIAGGPYGEDSDIRDAVGDCDSDFGAVAADPNSGMAMSAIVLGPAALVVLLFAIVLAGAVLLAAVYALYQSLKAVVTLVTGLLPGSARGALWMTLAELVMSLVTVMFSIVFLTGYLLIIQSVFASADPGRSHMATFFSVDILLLAGVVVFRKGRKRLKAAADRFAQALAARPGGSATTLPQKRPFSAAETYYKAKLAARVAHAGSGALRGGADLAARPVRWGIGKSVDLTAAGSQGVGRTVGTAWSRIQAAASAAEIPGRPVSMPDPPNAAQRLIARLEPPRRGRPPKTGRLLRMGTRVSLGAATGGTATAASAARRAAVNRTLRAAQKTSSASGPPVATPAARRLLAGERSRPPADPGKTRPSTAAARRAAANRALRAAQKSDTSPGPSRPGLVSAVPPGSAQGEKVPAPFRLHSQVPPPTRPGR